MPLLKIKKSESSLEYRYLLRSGTNSRKNERPYRFYPILEKDGNISMISKEEYNQIYTNQLSFDENFINNLRKKYEELGFNFILPISKDGEEKVWQRTFDRVCEECSSYIYDKGQIKIPPEDTRTPISLWEEDIYSNVQYGTNKLKELFDGKAPFDFSKSVFTVKDIVSLNTSGSDIILDFFSGSATTAQAVMQLNDEDKNTRQFIMVQIPEQLDPATNAYKMGYRTICDIGEERIRKIGKILSQNNSILDVGFRVLKIDDSNMKEVYYNPDALSQDLLSSLESNIKEDRSDLDLLFGCLLDLGLTLDKRIKEEVIDGKKILIYNDDAEEGADLIACFEDNISEELIKEIAKRKPSKAVFKDSSFANSPVKINLFELFKLYAEIDADELPFRVKVI